MQSARREQGFDGCGRSGNTARQCTRSAYRDSQPPSNSDARYRSDLMLLVQGIGGTAGAEDIAQVTVGHDVHAATIELDRAADAGETPRSLGQRGRTA